MYKALGKAVLLLEFVHLVERVQWCTCVKSHGNVSRKSNNNKMEKAYITINSRLLGYMTNSYSVQYQLMLNDKDLHIPLPACICFCLSTTQDFKQNLLHRPLLISF